MAIALAFFGAALAVGIHEAWTMRRGPIGWIVNIVVTLVSTFVAAQFGGLFAVLVLMLLPVTIDGSLAATGGPVLSLALVAAMIATLLGAWGALQIVNRWR